MVRTRWRCLEAITARLCVIQILDLGEVWPPDIYISEGLENQRIESTHQSLTVIR